MKPVRTPRQHETGPEPQHAGRHQGGGHTDSGTSSVRGAEFGSRRHDRFRCQNT